MDSLISNTMLLTIIIVLIVVAIFTIKAWRRAYLASKREARIVKLESIFPEGTGCLIGDQLIIDLSMTDLTLDIICERCEKYNIEVDMEGEFISIDVNQIVSYHEN